MRPVRNIRIVALLACVGSFFDNLVVITSDLSTEIRSCTDLDKYICQKIEKIL